MSRNSYAMLESGLRYAARRIAFVGLVALAFAATPFQATAIIVSDGELADADWRLGSRSGPNTVSVSVVGSQAPTGGNGGAFRSTTHSVSAAGPGFAFGWFWHLYDGQTHDPSTDGAVLTVAYSVDHIRFSSSTGQGTTTWVAIEQDGEIYLAHNGLTIDTAWATFSTGSLSALDFNRLNADGSGTNPDLHPDFGPGGSTLTFGVGFSNTPSGSTFSIDHGIDNFVADLELASPRVPISSQLGVFLLATLLAGAGAMKLRSQSSANARSATPEN